MLERLTPLLLILFAGILWQRLRPGGIDAAPLRRAINTLNITLLIPCLILHVILGTPLPAGFGAVPVTAALVILGALTLNTLIYGPLLRQIPPGGKGAMILAGSFGNGVGVALPVVIALVGEPLGSVPILYTLIASVPLAWTLGVMVALRHTTHALVRPMWQELLRSPPFAAVVVALICRELQLVPPTTLADTFEQLGRTALPLVIFVVGLSLNLRGIRRWWQVLPAVSVKSLVSPLLAWGLGSWFGLEGAVLTALVLTAATSSFNVGIVLSDRYGLDVDLYALAVAISSVIYFTTAPLWAVWLEAAPPAF